MLPLHTASHIIQSIGRSRVRLQPLAQTGTSHDMSGDYIDQLIFRIRLRRIGPSYIVARIKVRFPRAGPTRVSPSGAAQ
jgi:hypothetical protein